MLIDLALIESEAELACIWLENLVLVPLLHHAIVAAVARDLSTYIRVGSHHTCCVAHLGETALVDSYRRVERLGALVSCLLPWLVFLHSRQ